MNDLLWAKKKTVSVVQYSSLLEKTKAKNKKEIRDEFMKIVNDENIKTLFQPIISLKDGSVLGYEALSRGPKNSRLESPKKLFDLAHIHDKLWELELLCRVKALENASKECKESNIFINVDPEVINDEKFKKGFTKEFLKKYNIDPNNIVFEITEKNAVDDYNSFKKIIDNYKDQGYKIAVDDAGSGYSGLMMISEIHPHYIKLDMSLIRDIDKNGLKNALIKTFYDFCLITDIHLIAEGIESENELNALIDIGIDYGQGYYIQRPKKEIEKIDSKIVKKIKKRNKKKSKIYLSKTNTVFVGDICRRNITIEPNAKGADILDVFNQNSSVYALPVVKDEKVLGLIMREKFHAKLGTQYGFALYFNRPIRLIMNNNPLIIDYKTNIDFVSKLAMTRDDAHLYDYIIITKESKYYGVVTIKDLLEKTTQLEVNYAKHLNPLSGLPGNILIENKLKEYISKDDPYTVLYIDIDNFKVYNDVYGFEYGDKMIQAVSRIIKHCAHEYSDYEDFVGHIGGDDYVLGLKGFDGEKVCKKIISLFMKKIDEFYSKEDLEKKFVIAKNRHGVEEKFGHITLSIAGVTNKKKSFKDIYELSEYATQIKKKCKEVWDNYYLID